VELAAEQSSILVFLPGIAEISSIQDELGRIKDSRVALQLFVLHSLVPKEDQELALEPPLDGHCKVLLSTNIAETSLTIPDATLILDSGLRRCGIWIVHEYSHGQQD
jgi:HrpA-like RNA helicase